MRLQLGFVICVLAGSGVSAQQREDDKPLGLVQHAADRLAGGELAEAEGLIDQAWREALSGAAEEEFPARVQEIAWFDQLRGHELLASRRFRDALATAPAKHQLPLRIMAGRLYLAQRVPLQARKALERADALPDPRFRRQLLELLILAQEEMGDLDVAEASLRRKLALPAPDEKDEVLELKSGAFCGTTRLGLTPIVSELADFFTRHGRLAKARNELQAAARLDSSLPFESRAGAGLGLLHWLTNQKRQPEASELENRLLTMARTAGDADLRSAFLLKIAIAENARLSRDLVRAEAIYREALTAERLRGTGEKPLMFVFAFEGLLSELGRSPDEAKEWWMAWANPAPTPARANVTQMPQQPPTLRLGEPEEIQSQPGAKSAHLTRADLERAGPALTPVEASRFLTKHAAELARWELHSPRTALNLYEEFQRKEGAPDYSVIQCGIIEKYMSPRALLAFQDTAERVELLKRLKILEALEGPNSRDVQRTLIGLAGDFDEVEQWPQAKAYWDRAIQLTRRLYGEASHEYVSVLGDFADAAEWAEQTELAARIRAKAAAIRPE